MRVDSLIDGYGDNVSDGFGYKKMKRFARRFMGFLRHRQEGLNNDSKSAKGAAGYPAAPFRALFNATCTRLSLDRLLPSRACLRFTGQS